MGRDRFQADTSNLLLAVDPPTVYALPGDNGPLIELSMEGDAVVSFFEPDGVTVRYSCTLVEFVDALRKVVQGPPKPPVDPALTEMGGRR